MSQFRPSLAVLVPALLALTLAGATRARAQAATPFEGSTLALEADAISFFIGGYSGIANLSLRNGFQIAFGVGSYDVPSFLLEGDDHYDTAQWKARVPAVQVFRTGYRFRGPGRSGPALAAVVLNQDWRLRSAPLAGEARFSTLSVGLSGGWYHYIGKRFYVYPTFAFTHNSVRSGTTAVNGTNYKVEEFGPNASVHVGWDWAL